MRAKLVQAVALVKQMQVEKITLVKQLKRMDTENKRLKLLVGEFRLNTDRSDLSDCRLLTCPSKFMASHRKELDQISMRRQTPNQSSSKLPRDYFVSNRLSLRTKQEASFSDLKYEGAQDSHSLLRQNQYQRQKTPR